MVSQMTGNQLVVQQLVQINEENIKALQYVLCTECIVLKLNQITHQSSILLTLCEGNPLVTGGFPSQRASNVESVSMSWSHHDK